MKTTVICMIMLCSASLFAQTKFPQAYKASFGFGVESRFSTEDKTMAFGKNSADMAAMNTADGSIVWKINFAKDLGLKKIDYHLNYAMSKIVVLYTEGSKKEPSQKFFIDLVTGKLLWKTSEFGDGATFQKGLNLVYDYKGQFLGNKGDGLKFYNLRTGAMVREADVTESASSTKDMKYYGQMYTDELFIEMSYEKKLRSATSGNNQTEIEIVATDRKTKEVAWRTTFEGNVVAYICYYSLDLPIDVTLSWEVADNQIFVYYDGIAALDLKTGKVEWQATFDRSNYDFGLKATQTLNIAALPIITDDAVYYADLNKEARSIKKLNRKTGQVIWESEGLSKSDIVPNMYLDDGKLICQFGGMQSAIKTYDGNCWVEMEATGNFGLRAYDAQSGKIIWNSADKKSVLTEDFNKMISNVLVANHIVYAHGNEYLLAIEAATGKELFATNIKDLKVGKPVGISWIEEGKTILLRTEKSIITLDVVRGTVLTTTKIDYYFGEFWQEGEYFVWTGKKLDDRSEFACVDLKTGSVVGAQKDTPRPDFAPNGSFFLKYDSELVYRFNVR